jgi:SAM-dependent methyltransferase
LINEAIRNSWNSNSEEYYLNDIPVYNQVIENPTRAFPAAVYPLIQKYVGDLRGKKVLVPSSGDNVAVFGFHLLGAKVTSCDFAENQLKHPKAFADSHSWDIDFMLQNTMELDGIADNQYDLVYTSNGVHVWIDDLPGMYRNIHRALKPGGCSIFFETHPMKRPFDDSTYQVIIKKPYEDIGPHGEVPTYDWRIQDFINAVVSAGFNIREMQEFHSLRDDLEAHNYLFIREEHKDKSTAAGLPTGLRSSQTCRRAICICPCVPRG